MPHFHLILCFYSFSLNRLSVRVYRHRIVASFREWRCKRWRSTLSQGLCAFWVFGFWLFAFRLFAFLSLAVVNLPTWQRWGVGTDGCIRWRGWCHIGGIWSWGLFIHFHVHRGIPGFHVQRCIRCCIRVYRTAHFGFWTAFTWIRRPLCHDECFFVFVFFVWCW